MALSQGGRLRAALADEQPLQIAGVINAYCALLAEHAGFRALYLSGAGIANASYGIPDLGFTSLDNVLIDVRRVSAACDLPLLVDADTGWCDEGGMAATIQGMIEAGAAGVHLEDQVSAKRCGHRPGKVLVSTDEMVTRIEAAVAARSDGEFLIMARTDAAAVEGLDAAIGRALAYVDCGADAIFAEALQSMEQFRTFTQAVSVPVLANMTEFGQTPCLSLDELRQAGVSMALYPLSAFRAMNAAALKVYEVVRRDGTQQSVLDSMQTREALYRFLNYHDYETKIDRKRESEARHEC
jgi:methylisocitrate lyase